MSNVFQTAAETRRQVLVAKLRVIDPKLHHRYCNLYAQEALIVVVFVILLIGAPIGVGMYFKSISFAVLTLLSVVVLFFVISEARTEKPHSLLEKFEERLINDSLKTQEKIERIEQLSEENYKTIGTNIVVHERATLIIGSTIINSFNKIEKEDPELGEAISTLIGFVEEHENPDAAEALEDLVTEIEGERKPSRIRATWDYLVKLLPDVAKLSSAAAAIAKLF